MKSLSSLPTDEQGFALQTLIVTAVLVLLTVGAGVVVVAITRSSSDDLEGSQGDLEGRCQPWEIFDPELAAANAGGGKEILPVFKLSIPGFIGGNPIASVGAGGVTSSAIGCLAPCYLTLNDAHDLTLDLAVMDANNRPSRRDELPDIGVASVFGPRQGDLKFDTTNRLPEYTPIGTGEPAGLEVRVGIVTKATEATSFLGRFRFDTFLLKEDSQDSGPWEWLAENATTGSVWNSVFLLPADVDTQALFSDGSIRPSRAVYGTHDPPVLKESAVAIRVSTDSKACEIYDTITGEILLSSRDHP